MSNKVNSRPTCIYMIFILANESSRLHNYVRAILRNITSECAMIENYHEILRSAKIGSWLYYTAAPRSHAPRITVRGSLYSATATA